MFGFTFYDPIEKLIAKKLPLILYPWRASKWSSLFAGAAILAAHGGAGISDQLTLALSAISVFSLTFIAQWRRNISLSKPYDTCADLTEDKVADFIDKIDKASFLLGCKAANSCFETAKSILPFYKCSSSNDFYLGYQLVRVSDDFQLSGDQDAAASANGFIDRVKNR